MKNDLIEAKQVSFITSELITGLGEGASGCQKASLEAIGNKLVWPVVAIFPTALEAIALNKWRWGWVIQIVNMCVGNNKVVLDTQEDPDDPTNTKRIPFELDKHVGGAHKLFVTSEIIKLNCSTKVDSDIDISFYGNADVFVANVKAVFETENDNRSLVFDTNGFKHMDSIAMQKALAVMLDVEFFSEQHAFQGDNATVNEDGQMVPVMSEKTWYLSRRRLENIETQAPGFQSVPYPIRDMYLNQPVYKADNERKDDGEIELLMESDGYYTRPVYMYVADPKGFAKPGMELTNIEVVRNSFRALMMVVLENVGFAMEYVDPEKHGICPTLKSRAQKISKYAMRVSMALKDANHILKIDKIYDTGGLFNTTWWDTAGQGRDNDTFLLEAFPKVGNMLDSPMDIGNNGLLKGPLVENINVFLDESMKIIETINNHDSDSNSSDSTTFGGGEDSARSWATMMFLGLLTLVASASPRPGVF